MTAKSLKGECDRLNAINAELLAALQACRPFVSYTQAYDQRRMTAGEAKACDEAVLLTNAILRKMGGRSQ